MFLIRVNLRYLRESAFKALLLCFDFERQTIVYLKMQRCEKNGW